MKNSKLSIVIACYNDHKYIEEAVESARAQTWENKEIIVVDDGSDEQTKKVIQSLKSKIDILITQENRGTSAARNKGIQAASGEYILILDSDDYFDTTFCEKALNEFGLNPHLKLVTCYARLFDIYKTLDVYEPQGGTVKDFLFSNSAVGNALFKKKDFAKSGGYDTKMKDGFEDWEFYIRLLHKGGEAKVIPEVLFNYRNKPFSRNKNANLKKYELLEYIYIKHADLYKEHFPFFMKEWLRSVKKSEAFKQQVMDSLDYKVGHKMLKPLRILGIFRKNKK